ncbi:MAG: glycoside hydrolase family 16 protein [Methylophilaceae bacterium]|nr:MAG: glycoside hydrolase family 16 protein [Methylophilaceae bacterium]
MSKKIWQGICSSGLMLVLLINVSAPSSSAANNSSPKLLKLLWSDEFAGKKGALPNSKYWSFDIGNSYGWGNSELEYYTQKPANVSTDGKGKLLITANRISDTSGMQTGKVAGTEAILNSCPECQFTSAKIKTGNKLGFLYGRLEIRMKSPAGVGTWPALWMLGNDLLAGNPWPECGEIDIMEGRGYMGDAVFGTIHGPNFPAGAGAGYSKVVSNGAPLSDAFHTFAIEWKKNQIDLYLDDQMYFSATPKDIAPGRWVFNQEFWLIINLAMGGNFTGDIDPTLNQSQMSIDYIRYYSINGVGKLIKH